VFGLETLDAALAEWAHVFHLNYETYVLAGGSPSASC